jgi:aminopeptidase-like protein
VLNQSDGAATLLDIAGRSALPYASILRAAERLQHAGLLAEDSGRR